MDSVDEFLNSLIPEFPKRYDGKISIDQATFGIKKVVENGEDLLDDSLILFNSGKYSRALTLAILAIEEVSKIDIIKKILLSQAEAGEIWKEFANHKFKNHLWFYPVLKKFNASGSQVKDYQGVKSKWVEKLNNLKNNSIYVSPHFSNSENEKISWLAPNDFIDRDLCGMFLVIANEVVKDDRILWNSESLKIFLKYHVYKEKKIVSKSPHQFYSELLREKLISKERFDKIIRNLKN